MKIVGEITKIYDIEEIGNGDNSFRKQTIVIKSKEEVEYPDEVAIDFTGEKLIFVDGLKAGDDVEVYFATRVRESEKGGVFNTLRGWKVVID